MDGELSAIGIDRRIRLAGEPEFRLGGLSVTPSTRQVRFGGETRRLEPRVMQVLILLARADGAVVGREDLIERCWDGRIVGDDAINRVISVLRQLAAYSGAFRLETVTKVGYRLEPSVSAQKPLQPVRSRRWLAVAGVSMAAAAAGGAWLWRSGAQADLSPQAREYLRQGREALRAARSEQDKQAVAYFRQATELSPRSSEAWGALALALVTQVGQRGPEAIPSDVAWIESAAHRALELDPANGDAEAALLQLRPVYGHWTERDRDYRAALTRHPGLPPLMTSYSALLNNVGRWRESASLAEELAKKYPMAPAYHIGLATTLWGAQRFADADRAFAECVKLFPAHGWAWTARFDFLMLNGRPAEAIASAADPATRPSGPLPMPIDLGLKVADAIQTREANAVRHAVQMISRAFELNQLAPPKCVAYLCGLGAVDEAYRIIDSLYFGKPNAPTPPAAPTAPSTFVLFGAATKRLRADARFSGLVERMGFEAFWRETGVEPDYRR